ncbi:OstA-like protein [Hydrogenispora ethanolica]|uniref:OstA-like protein n=1 Tax=Hydrogenispora ethanolica TaxID=1082276 RepID=A0A4R1RDW0_HYDET|nr:LptA/OstA family protein [Hydrogenispora ethanolica]TCL63742.1 OstA-like protein [Hydrogenispora ethanolica]
MRHWRKLLWVLVLIPSLAWAAAPMELVAPAGGEMDLKRNTMQYYGTETQPVTVRWNNSVLEAKYLEYDRNQEVVTGKQSVQLIQTNPNRTMHCEVIVVEMKKDRLVAMNHVALKYDENTSFTGERLEWDRANDVVVMTGKPELDYKEWQLTGERMEGQVVRGTLTITGSAQIQGNETIARAGKILFNRDENKVVLQQNPVVVRGNSELTATEIIYDLTTKKITANGGVQSRINKESR